MLLHPLLTGAVARSRRISCVGSRGNQAETDATSTLTPGPIEELTATFCR